MGYCPVSSQTAVNIHCMPVKLCPLKWLRNVLLQNTSQHTYMTYISHRKTLPQACQIQIRASYPAQKHWAKFLKHHFRAPQYPLTHKGQAPSKFARNTSGETQTWWTWAQDSPSSFAPGSSIIFTLFLIELTFLFRSRILHGWVDLALPRA
jgi:hypothetical protein